MKSDSEITKRHQAPLIKNKHDHLLWCLDWAQYPWILKLLYLNYANSWNGRKKKRERLL